MKFYLIILFSLFFVSKGKKQDLNENSFEESSFFTTWATAVYETESPKMKLTNNSLRQIIHVSASGENVRLKLSNKNGKTDLEIKEVTIADSLTQGTGEIELKTLTTLYFEGEKNIIISPGKEIYSDVISYSLKPLSDIAISIYFGKTPENLTGHPKSRTYSFIEKGNKIYNETISRENKIDHWYIISALEVSSNPRKKTIVCFGDSITDGTGTTMDKQNRWPDLLSAKLHLNKETNNIAVVNKGIGGDKITTQGLERFSYDVLEVKGVSHIIVLYGVNDINVLNATSSQIILAYKKLIEEAHKNNIFIYGGTILPEGNYGLWSEEKEKYRKEVNYWIKNTKKEEGGFDGFFDFDEFIRDPDNHNKIFNLYDCGDGLHPNEEGYQRMTQAINNLDIFTLEPDFNSNLNEINLFDKIGIKFKLNFNLKKDEEIFISIKGRSDGSNGFRVLTTNNEDIKTSDYYYTGNILEGKFWIINIKLKAYDSSNYIVIKRPISTMNIDNIILEYIEVSSGNNTKIFSPADEGTFLD